MNNDLQSALSQILLDASGGIQNGITFLSDQLPDVAQQLLTYKLIVNIAGSVGLTLLILVAWSFYVYVGKRPIKRGVSEGKTVVFILCGVALVLAGIFGFMSVWSMAGDALKIYFAPKVYLVEYAANLMRGVR